MELKIEEGTEKSEVQCMYTFTKYDYTFVTYAVLHSYRNVFETMIFITILSMIYMYMWYG